MLNCPNIILDMFVLGVLYWANLKVKMFQILRRSVNTTKPLTNDWFAEIIDECIYIYI